MSELNYNFEFFSNFSSDENDYDQLKPLIFQLFLALKKIYMNRIGSFFFKIFHNYGKSILKTDSNYEQDVFVKRLKFQILQIKLGSMLNILLKHLQFYQIYFLSKLMLKINIQNVLYSNDNYLNIQTNKELQRIRNFAAYLKLIYVIRVNYYKKIILKNFFHKFKEILDTYTPPKQTVLKYLLFKKISDNGQHYRLRNTVFKLWKFKVITYNSISRLKVNPLSNSENGIIKLLYFIINKNEFLKSDFFSRIKSKVREEYETNYNNTEFFKQMTDELNVINSIISFKTKENYLMQPPSNINEMNRLYLESFHNLRKSLGENIKHYKSLQCLKGLLKVYCREYVEKRLYSYFNRWKTKSDLIGYEHLNEEIHRLYILKKDKTLNLLEKVLERFRYINKYFTSIFFEKLILNTKLKNSLSRYGEVYNKIQYKISDQETKEVFIKNRVTFQKILSIRKAIEIINKIRFEGPRFDKNNNIIRSDDFKVNSSFLKWKKLTIVNLQFENSKIIRICKLINSFKNNVYKRMLLFFQRLTDKNRKKNTISRLIKLAFFNMFANIRNCINRLKIFGFAQIIRFIYEKESIKKTKIKCILYNKLFIDRLSLKINKRTRFREWKKLAKKEEIVISNIIDYRKYFVTQRVYQFYKFHIIFNTLYLRNIFSILKKRTFIRNKNSQKSSLDLMIIENQARVCLELEKQDNHLTELLEKKKLFLFTSDKLLKIFYRKHISFNVYLQYFREWKYKSVNRKNETIISLMNAKSNMQVEYDYLVKELDDKKQTIEKIKEEYDILKKNFCKNCLQEDQLIILPKSNEYYVSNENLQVSKPNNELLKNQLEERNRINQQRNLLSNIVEMEEKINKLKIDYDQKLDANEKFLKIYEEKKYELTEIKNQIINKFKDKSR